MKTLAVLLLTVTIGSNEQTYGPYLRPTRGELPAVAVAGNRMLLAWSEVDPKTGRAAIRIGLLDTQAQLVGSIHTIPATRATADATGPAVTTDGTQFSVTWLESDRGQQRMSIVVDAAGDPVGEPHLFIPQPSPFSAVVVKTVIYTDCFHFHCIDTGRRNYDISWRMGANSGTYQTGEEAITTLGMAPGGEHLVMAWPVRYGVSFYVSDGTAGSVWAEPETYIAPAVACDDTDCIVAYGTISGDVHAVTFPMTRPTDTSMFVVAASERQERAPRLHLIRKGRFLVTYQSDQIGDAKLAGRIITLGAVKRRSAR